MSKFTLTGDSSAEETVACDTSEAVDAVEVVVALESVDVPT